mgnify:CR=1 FL=1
MIHYKMYFSPYDWEIEVYVVLKQCFINTIIESLKDCIEYKKAKKVSPVEILVLKGNYKKAKFLSFYFF